MSSQRFSFPHGERTACGHGGRRGAASSSSTGAAGFGGESLLGLGLPHSLLRKIAATPRADVFPAAVSCALKGFFRAKGMWREGGVTKSWPMSMSRSTVRPSSEIPKPVAVMVRARRSTCERRGRRLTHRQRQRGEFGPPVKSPRLSRRSLSYAVRVDVRPPPR